jgi:hypothetical protein
MTYDQWKTQSGYDEREECEHEVFEIDMEGRAHCDACSATWWASKIEIDHQREQQAEYDTWCRQQERREFWRTLTLPIRWPIFRLLEKVWPRKSLSVLTDDEIPF